MDILYITQVDTFPVVAGERLRSYGLLKILSGMFDHITAIIEKCEISDDERKDFNKVDFYIHDFQEPVTNSKIKRHFKHFIQNKNLLEKIENIYKGNYPEYVFIDYYFNGQYISYFKGKGCKVIYGTHNIQSRLNLQIPARTFKRGITKYITYLIDRLHERFFFPKADALICVSLPDYKHYKRYIPEQKIFNIPNMLDESIYKVQSSEKENYLIMTGNFFAFQNRRGLEWFLGNVWDEEISLKTKLKLVGLHSKEVFSEISDNYNTSNIEVLGKVSAEDMKALISKAKASIVPLLDGSGTRLKCIEALALKTQLISTSKGAEGIEHKGEILICDTPADYKKAIFEVISGKIDHVEKGRIIFESIYSVKANQKTFQKLITYISRSQKS